MKFRHVLVALLASFGVIGTLWASPAQAATASYGTYKYEGTYPTATPCNGSFAQPLLRPTKVVIRDGYVMRLKYYYNSSCGSFARIEGVPSGGKCWVYIDRSDDGGKTWVYARERVDVGDYAYTKMGNNLNGRVSRAALACNIDDTPAHEVLARTDWY